MSDKDKLDATGDGEKRGEGRNLVDAAMRAEAEGNPEADLLSQEAGHTDPEAVANALTQEDIVKGAARRGASSSAKES